MRQRKPSLRRSIPSASRPTQMAVCTGAPRSGLPWACAGGSGWLARAIGAAVSAAALAAARDRAGARQQREVEDWDFCGPTSCLFMRFNSASRRQRWLRPVALELPRSRAASTALHRSRAPKVGSARERPPSRSSRRACAPECARDRWRRTQRMRGALACAARRSAARAPIVGGARFGWRSQRQSGELLFRATPRVRGARQPTTSNQQGRGALICFGWARIEEGEDERAEAPVRC